MNALQPTGGEPIARVVLLSILAVATLGAQSPTANREALERLASRGVFEGANKIDAAPDPPSPADERAGWLTFYVIYTDDVLARYAPGGAMGARFDVFQFGGFPGAQPRGYRIHIIVRDGCISLVGVVESAADRARAEVRARESAGGRVVENALLVEP